MESGKEGSAPPSTPKSKSQLGFSGIKGWLEKVVSKRPKYSQQNALSESLLGLPGDSGGELPSLPIGSTAERQIKPEIPIPGVAPIPEGNIRLFHFTFPRNLESVRSQGITSPKIDVNENGLNSAPNSTWVYSDLNFNEPPGWTIGLPYFEFSAPADDMGPHNAHAKEGTARTLKPGVDVPQEWIVAIHEPWHEMVRHSSNGVIDPDWLKSYIDRSVQVSGMRGTRGNYTNYSEMTVQQQYLESQVIEANKYLNFSDSQSELV